MSARRRKKKAKRPREFKFKSDFHGHERVGNTLVPPFARLAEQVNLTKTRWYHDRVPELLWACLLRGELRRETCLSVFRQVASFFVRYRKTDQRLGPTLSGIATASVEDRECILRIITSDESLKSALRPLLFFDSLPARNDWLAALGPEIVIPSWEPIAESLFTVYDHQSEAATDVRWLRVTCEMAAGRVHFVDKPEFHEMGAGILGYPNVGDLAVIRPWIRTLESSWDPQMGGSPETHWPATFWKECYGKTPCVPVTLQQESSPQDAGSKIEDVAFAIEAVVRHANATRPSSDIDPRHEAAFGLVLYSLHILLELLQFGLPQSILARLGLRTIAEATILLGYLTKKNDPQIWQTFRVFGAGQGKLTHMKLEGTGLAPFDLAFIKILANEDEWEEYLTINLGHWNKQDLRKLSVEAGLKDDVYDRYYGWLSTYGHAYWGALRESTFDTCSNPLHRFHRIPKHSATLLPDVVPDACQLARRMFAFLNALYPGLDQELLPSTTPITL